MQFDISTMLTSQVTTRFVITCKKILLKKIQEYKNMGRLDQNSHVNKNYT